MGRFLWSKGIIATNTSIIAPIHHADSIEHVRTWTSPFWNSSTRATLPTVVQLDRSLGTTAVPVHLDTNYSTNIAKVTLVIQNL